MPRFNSFLFAALATVLASALNPSTTYAGDPMHPLVRLKTNFGDILMELNKEKAPKSVENFLTYVGEGYYDNTIFHRVINGFMIQGGGYTQDYKLKQPHPSIDNEADNGLKNLRGTVAMARTSMPHSASSQFFINVADNDFLDFRSPTKEGWGYAVFGKITQGMDVVEKIKKTPTGSGGSLPSDVPQEAVIILKATLEP